MNAPSRDETGNPPTAELPAALRDASGRGVRVAVLDTGIDDSHPALAGASVDHFEVIDVPGGTAVVPAPSRDATGHGTAVASILHRHAPGAALTSVRVFGAGHRGTTQRLFAALDWAIANGYDVVNTSLGTTYLGLLAKFKQRVDAAFVSRCIIVSASNNLDPDVIEFPAHFATVVSVSHAPVAPLALERVPGRLVEFRATGVDVRAAWRGGGWATLSGSSFAAPHAGALVARLREVHGAWNAIQVKAALYDVATPAEPPCGR